MNTPVLCMRCGRPAETSILAGPVCYLCAQAIADEAEARMNDIVAEAEAAEEEEAFSSDPDYQEFLRNRNRKEEH